MVLATINARYSHASFGLRYLMANLGELQAVTRLLEFDLRAEVDTIAAQILEALHPRIVGVGVYIWNVTEQTWNWCGPCAHRNPRAGHRAGRPGGQPRKGSAGDLRAGRLRDHR